MRIVLNTEKSYELSELAKATANDPSDLIYIVKQVDGKDVSFAVDREQFLQGITGGSNSKFIIDGGVVWTGSGLVFDVTAISYNFFGATDITPATQITLDAGDSQPRFDAFVVDVTTNTVVVVKGTPAADPLIPQVGTDQIFIQATLVGANATTPTITNDFVYRENVEWATSTYTVGSPTPGTVDFESTDDPFEGTFCIKSNTSRSTGMRFQRTGSIKLGNDTGEFSNLSFRIRFETPLPSNRKLLSSVWLSGSTVGQTANFSAFGINPNLVGEWQTIVIPTSVFNTSEIDRIQIRMDGGTNSEQVEYFLDYIVFSTGVAAPTQVPTITVQDEGTSVGTRPKLNFIPGTNITFSIADDAVNDRVNITINSTGGAGGSAVWGDITGTLADQTDLQNALDQKLESIVAGDNIEVDNADPLNPIVSSTVTPGGAVDSVTGTTNEIDVDSTDPVNPVVSLATTVKNAIADALTALQPGDNVSTLTNDAAYVNAAGAASAAPIQSVTGTQVGGTASDPVIDLPTPAEIGAYPDTNPDSFITEADVTDTPRQYTKGQGGTLVTLTSVSNATPIDFEDGNFFTYTAVENSTLSAPSTDQPFSCVIFFEQDATGGRTFAFNAAYDVFGDDIPTTANDKALIQITSDGAGELVVIIQARQ